MPGDIQTFDMLRRGILEGLSDALLWNEIERVRKMRIAVEEYHQLVAAVIAARGPAAE